MPEKLNVIGEKYGQLKVLADAPYLKKGKRRVACICDCGKEKTFLLSNLRTGHTTSCGCVSIPDSNYFFKHGLSNTSEYKAYSGMMERCYNPNSKSYPNYGGRGIKVCDRWKHNFENFYADVGKKPSDAHSLDRYPDMNGNYEPNNVRWATKFEQQRNTTRNTYFEHDGRSMIKAEIVREFGIASCTIYRKQQEGWDMDSIIAKFKKSDSPLQLK